MMMMTMTATTATAATAATMMPNGDKTTRMASAAVNNAGTKFAGTRVPGNVTGSRSVEVAWHARLSPFVGVGAGLTIPVGIGKDGGQDGWLCWGWRGGVADYWGTKNEKGKSENLACGWG